MKSAVGATLALGSAWVAMCSGGGADARVATPLPPSPVAPPVASAAAGATSRPLGAPAAPPALTAPPPPFAGTPPELARFSNALSALERQTRADSVRILWFGDSHTAADFLTGAVRSALAHRYGSGGPGFVRLGVGSYRHDLAFLNRIGLFKVEPQPPSRRSPQGDGVFGLGGMRAIGMAVPARMTLKLPASALLERARYSLLFELPPGASFLLTHGGESLTVRDPAQARRIADSPILRLDFEASPAEVINIEMRRGRPIFFGVVVEGTKPGLVLDTLGIDGARVATPLAWAEAPFEAEVAARRPDLVVLAYGTNEAFDELRVDAYDAELKKLLARLKKAAPSADCLVLGPPDALSTSGESVPRVASISAVYASVALQRGCAFVSLQSLMGGPGGFASWLRQEPQLARPDRLHLTPKGYRKLGELLALAAFGAEPPVVAKNSP
jgi:lysophospholipase L1-like esterase